MGGCSAFCCAPEVFIGHLQVVLCCNFSSVAYPNGDNVYWESLMEVCFVVGSLPGCVLKDAFQPSSAFAVAVRLAVSGNKRQSTNATRNRAGIMASAQRNSSGVALGSCSMGGM